MFKKGDEVIIKYLYYDEGYFQGIALGDKYILEDSFPSDYYDSGKYKGNM